MRPTIFCYGQGVFMVSRSDVILTESGQFSLEIARGDNERNIDAALEVAREKMADPEVEWSRIEINYVKDHAVIVSWTQPVRRSVREELLEQIH
jgi:hypothetical protein